MYPSFDIQDEHVDQFLEQHKPKLGDEMEARVKLKVNHMSQSQHGKRIGFDVTELHAPAGKKTDQAPSKTDVAGMLKSAMMANG